MFKLVPIRPLRQVRKYRDSANSEAILDQFFDSFFNEEVFTSLSKLDRNINGFLVDVLDDGDKYIIEAELPGFEKENVKVEYRDQHLTIIARRAEESEEKCQHYIRKERSCGEFKRSFFVDNINPDKTDASFENGILKVFLQKVPLKNNSKQIVIK
ncbi:MAG: heat-shock protein [Clostridiales bacterium]|nr:MAG: heat-shock protein [Clostridiales bacterium]PIE77146.1 MAG: heat-shock protein [Clostridiales bacterium]